MYVFLDIFTEISTFAFQGGTDQYPRVERTRVLESLKVLFLCVGKSQARPNKGLRSLDRGHQEMACSCFQRSPFCETLLEALCSPEVADRRGKPVQAKKPRAPCSEPQMRLLKQQRFLRFVCVFFPPSCAYLNPCYPAVWVATKASTRPRPYMFSREPAEFHQGLGSHASSISGLAPGRVLGLHRREHQASVQPAPHQERPLEAWRLGFYPFRQSRHSELVPFPGVEKGPAPITGEIEGLWVSSFLPLPIACQNPVCLPMASEVGRVGQLGIDLRCLKFRTRPATGLRFST